MAKWYVEFVVWNGELGKKADFEPYKLHELIDERSIHPIPAPLFDTEPEAEAFAQRNYALHVQAEITRLRDVGKDEYNAHKQHGLMERHEFLKSERRMQLTPTEPPAPDPRRFGVPPADPTKNV